MGLFDSLRRSVAGYNTIEKWQVAAITEGAVVWQRGEQMLAENHLMQGRTAIIAATAATARFRVTLEDEELRKLLPENLFGLESVPSLLAIHLSAMAFELGSVFKSEDAPRFLEEMANTSPRPELTRTTYGQVAGQVKRAETGEVAKATLTAISNAYGLKLNLGTSGILVISATLEWGNILVGTCKVIDRPGRWPYRFDEAFLAVTEFAAQKRAEFARQHS